VLIGCRLAPPLARLFGVGKTMVAAHALFGVLGLPLALSAFMPRYAALLVFVSEFLQLSVNAVYMVNRTSVEQALSTPQLRGRIQTTRTVFHAITGVLGLTFGGVVGAAASPAAAIVIGVLGGLTGFTWLLFSPVRIPMICQVHRAESGV
jgi:MFS family permease